MILGRPSLNTLGAIVSTPHLPLKFVISATEVGFIHADQKDVRRCYHESLSKKGKEAEIERTQEVHMAKIDQNRNMNIKDMDPREERRARP